MLFYTVQVDILSRGSAVIGSDTFLLRCNAFQRPWNAQVLVNEWSTDSENPLTDNAYRSIGFMLDPPYPGAFVLNGTLSFNPLRVQDLGPYSCYISLNLTYPDGPNNSTAIISNSTSFVLTAEGKCSIFECYNVILFNVHSTFAINICDR